MSKMKSQSWEQILRTFLTATSSSAGHALAHGRRPTDDNLSKYTYTRTGAGTKCRDCTTNSLAAGIIAWEG